jgi:hypothetical protein
MSDTVTAFGSVERFAELLRIDCLDEARLDSRALVTIGILVGDSDFGTNWDHVRNVLAAAEIVRAELAAR